jgi:hypothetical protein
VEAARDLEERQDRRELGSGGLRAGARDCTTEAVGPAQVLLGRGEGRSSRRHRRRSLERGGGALTDPERHRRPQVLGDDLGDVVASSFEGVGGSEVQAGPAEVVMSSTSTSRTSPWAKASVAGSAGASRRRCWTTAGSIASRHSSSVQPAAAASTTELEVAPEDGGQAEELEGGLRQLVEAAPEHVAHTGGDSHACDRGVGSPSSSSSARRRASWTVKKGLPPDRSWIAAVTASPTSLPAATATSSRLVPCRGRGA